jgi:hypothetical protein
MADQMKLDSKVATVAGAAAAHPRERLQSLWSGYGAIWRYELEAGPAPSVVVKSVTPPAESRHPRGFSSVFAHARKLESYRVEQNWYENYSARCGRDCRVPRLFGAHCPGASSLFVLEDLDAAGFPVRAHTPTRAQVRACLRWLATFHATFLASESTGLWPVGTYWHLATRPEELSVMPEGPIKASAARWDSLLAECEFLTIVHGDAKLANFCFSSDGDSVAAVDFQYVGTGCGMKDVAYFFSSCFDEDECEKRTADLLNDYFSFLRSALKGRLAARELTILEEEWRGLYPVAWADFVRFLLGWAPEHFKLHGYSRKRTEQALRLLSL